MIKHLIIVVLALYAPSSLGAQYMFGTSTGLMQQPSSQYYHLVYGAYVGLGSEKGGLYFRTDYLERPKFTNAGFYEEESGIFAITGSKLWTSKGGGLFLEAGFGYGLMSGLIAPKDKESELPKRSYRLNGVAFESKMGAQWRAFQITFGFRQFTGFVDSTEVDASVAWPFSFYTLNAGLLL